MPVETSLDGFHPRSPFISTIPRDGYSHRNTKHYAVLAAR